MRPDIVALVDQIFSALVLLVCLVLLARLALGEQRRARLHGLWRSAMQRLRNLRRRKAAPVRLVGGRAARAPLPRELTQRTQIRPPPVRALDESAAAQEAAELIQRAKRGAADTRSPGEGEAPDDDKVIRPDAWRRPRKLH